MPLRRPVPPPDPARVSRALGAAPARSRTGWTPAAPRDVTPPVPHGEGGVDEEIAKLDADLRAARRPGFATVPESIRRGRVVVSQTAVVAAIALVVALGTAFAVRALWAERAATDGGPVALDERRAAALVTSTDDGASRASGTAPAASSAGPGLPSDRGADDSAADIVVHVAGRVRRPGVVTLPAGARVVDAVARAGGAASDADLSSLNLARVLADGEQVYVPRPGEGPPDGAQAGAGVGSAGGPGTAAGTPAVVNINTADAATLETLPGVGPVLAGRILDRRLTHGRFTSVDELTDVSGIGEKLFAQLRPLVTV